MRKIISIKSLGLFGCALFLASCGYISGSISPVQDFKKTTISVGGVGVADGIQGLVITVHLMNGDGTVVPNYLPTYTITAGTDVITSSCTVSDNNGISTCILKSTAPGTKTIALTDVNGLIITQNVIFQAKQTQFYAVTSGGSTTVSTTGGAGGYKVTASIGEPVQSPVVSTAGGYKIYGSIQGAMNENY